MALNLPTVQVIGDAEREVVPDEVVVVVVIETPVMSTPADALSLGVSRRGRVREALASGAPEAEVSDARVTTVAEYEHVEEPDAQGRVTSRSIVRGHRGLCELRGRAKAARAAALVGVLGTHSDVARVRPIFVVSRTLARSVERELGQEAVRDALGRAKGLARAAGMRLGEVIAIGEPPGRADPHESGMLIRATLSDAHELEDSLGELIPMPQTLSARIAVTVALLPGD